MDIDNLGGYLKKLSSSLNRRKGSEAKVRSIFNDDGGDYEIDIDITDEYETMGIVVVIPYKRSDPAKIRVDREGFAEVSSKIGNARDVTLEHDLDTVSQIIIAGIKSINSLDYIHERFRDIFGKTKNQASGKKAKEKKAKKESTGKDTLENIVERANIKGAKIVKWYTTPGHKVVLKFGDKDKESYGSEYEAMVHLYYAYMLKNKDRSNKKF